MTFNSFPIPTKPGFEALLVEKAQDVATSATAASLSEQQAQTAAILAGAPIAHSFPTDDTETAALSSPFLFFGPEGIQSWTHSDTLASLVQGPYASRVEFDTPAQLFAYDGPALPIGLTLKTRTQDLTYGVIDGSETPPDWRDIGATRIAPVYVSDPFDHYARAYEMRKYRRAGRQVLLADNLVSLTYSDDTANDNTAALQTLADRATRRNEIIRFSSGVLRHEALQFTSEMYWEGPEDQPTIFKLRDGLTGADYSQVEIGNGADYGALENLVFDGNRDSTSFTGNSEGLEYDNCEGWLHFWVSGRNATRDAFDHDSSKNHIYVSSTSTNPGKDGFHNSGGSYNNWHLACQSIGASGVRGAFTAIDRSSPGRHVFIDCIGAQSSRGFQIQIGDNADGPNNTVINCLSIGNAEADVVDGIGIGSPPSNDGVIDGRIDLGGIGVQNTFTIDFNNPPPIGGIFATGGSSTNGPPGSASGTLIQVVTGAGAIRQTFIRFTGEAFTRQGSGAWMGMAIAAVNTDGKFGPAQTVNFDLNDPPTGNVQAFMAASSPNVPAGSSGGMLTQAESGAGRIMQTFQTVIDDELHVRTFVRGSPSSWKKVAEPL